MCRVFANATCISCGELGHPWILVPTRAPGASFLWILREAPFECPGPHWCGVGAELSWFERTYGGTPGLHRCGPSLASALAFPNSLLLPQASIFLFPPDSNSSPFLPRGASENLHIVLLKRVSWSPGRSGAEDSGIGSPAPHARAKVSPQELRKHLGREKSLDLVLLCS